MQNFKVLERLWIKGSIVNDQHLLTDVLAKMIQSCPNLPLKFLSIRAAVLEDALLYCLEGKVFPMLEVLTIDYRQLTTNYARICSKIKNPNLKKLNLRGSSISTRKQFAEDVAINKKGLTEGYVRYASGMDAKLMVKYAGADPDEFKAPEGSHKCHVTNKPVETDASDELESVRERFYRDPKRKTEIFI